MRAKNNHDVIVIANICSIVFMKYFDNMSHTVCYDVYRIFSSEKVTSKDPLNLTQDGPDHKIRSCPNDRDHGPKSV